MNFLKYFLIGLGLTVGCQKGVEVVDWDGGEVAFDEFDTTHLMGDPIPSSQEFLIIPEYKETPSIE